jgi:mRNA interferase MazF
MALEAAAIRRGAVILVRLSRDKARPAVVVRSDLLSGLSYATVLPITSEIRADISLRVDITPTPENGLRMASQVMADWPQTVRFSEIDRPGHRPSRPRHDVRHHAPDGCRVGDRSWRGQTSSR